MAKHETFSKILPLIALAALGAILVLVVAPALIWLPGGKTALFFYSLGQKLINVLMAVALFAFVDSRYMPWLKIEEVVFGEGEWVTVPVEIRGQVIRYWGLFKAAVIFVVGFGG